MICERCGCFFCWDEADETIFTGARRRFCSRHCTQAAGHKRREAVRTENAARKAAISQRLATCPYPQKKAFKDKEIAVASALNASRDYGMRFRAYRCPCGWWHLTARYPDRPPVYG